MLHPHGIAPTFFKLDSWSPGTGFIPNISTKGINQIKKENFKKKVKFLCIQKDLWHFLKEGCNSVWVQFHVYYFKDM